MYWKSHLAALVFLLLCIGCESTLQKAPPEPALPAAEMASVTSSPTFTTRHESLSLGRVAAPAAEATTENTAKANDQSVTARPDRVLIYTATLQMAVPDVEDALAAVQKFGESSGGYLHHMSTESVTIRVPAAKFREILDKLRPLGHTLRKQIDVQDVTDQYVDLQLRLKNSEALMERLNSLLAKAQTMKDTLDLEREMSRLRVEIERIKGQLTQLDRLIAYSTITVNFVKATAPVVSVSRPETPFPWITELGVESVLKIRNGGAQ